MDFDPILPASRLFPMHHRPNFWINVTHHWVFFNTSHYSFHFFHRRATAFRSFVKKFICLVFCTQNILEFIRIFVSQGCFTYFSTKLKSKLMPIAPSTPIQAVIWYCAFLVALALPNGDILRPDERV